MCGGGKSEEPAENPPYGFEHKEEGEWTYASGIVYSGSWIKGQRHGQGKLLWADGTFYKGEFKDDKCAGKGDFIT